MEKQTLKHTTKALPNKALMEVWIKMLFKKELNDSFSQCVPYKLAFSMK